MRKIKITLLSVALLIIFASIFSLVTPSLAAVNNIPSLRIADAGAGAEFNQAQEQAASKAAAAAASGSAVPADTKVELFKDLGGPQDPRAIIGTIIKGVLGVVGSVALVLFIYGGLEIMLSRGDSGEIKKGQDTMIWAAIGLAVIFASYAITSYVIENISKPSV